MSHPDRLTADFICSFLKYEGFRVTVSNSNVHAFTICVKDTPDLIVMNRDSPLLDAHGFLIKKEHSSIAEVPIVMIGDFLPAEVASFKERHVVAFLARHIDPDALRERAYQFLGLPLPTPPRRTPLLVDVHARAGLLIVQLEGNLEPDRLMVLNYQLLRYMVRNGVESPAVMFIVPNLYPDLVTDENVRLMFGFADCEAVRPDLSKVVLLSRVPCLVDRVKAHPDLSAVRVYDSYYEAFRALVADFDVDTDVRIDSFRPGDHFFLDLYDLGGVVLIQAMTPVTAELIEELKQRGVRTLRYRGEVNERADGRLGFDPQQRTLMEYITCGFSQVPLETFGELVEAEKQNLYLTRLKGREILFVSLDRRAFGMVQRALGAYFSIVNAGAGEDLGSLVGSGRFAIVFVDLSIPMETVLGLLHAVRASSSRRRTSIILMAAAISKPELMTYRRFGTDHVVVKPFTTGKVFHKVYEAMTTDRGT